MPTYSVSIQAHPSRAAWVAELVATLGDVPVAWSQQPGDEWDTWKRAVAMRDHSADFHLTIEDDAVLCRNFRSRVEEALARGDFAYCFFYRMHMANRATHAAAKSAIRLGSGGFTSARYGTNVASAIPERHIERIIEFGNTRPHLAIDKKAEAWLASRHVKTFFPVPSLANHRGEVSLIGPGRKVRVASFWED